MQIANPGVGAGMGIACRGGASLKGGGNSKMSMKVIAKLDISDNTCLKLQVGEYREQPRVDLRIFVKKDDGEIIPTQKGINFHAEWTDEFVKMIEKLKDVE